MLNALLIQLFGREVIESLARAGFDGPEAISAAGPERLAEEGAISLSMARRIIAVAMEEPAPRSERGDRSEAAEPPEAPEPHPTAEGHETAEPPEPAERHVRRPFRRPHHALAPPDFQESPAEPDRPKADSSARDDERPRKRDEGDPFVDDVGLVSWMAAASREGSGRSSSFTVADEVRGRVAVVRAGDHVALAVASWPMGAPPEVVDDVDAMIGSLGPVPGALAPGVF